MHLMDLIQQPDVLKIILAVLGIYTTIATAWAYRAKKSADTAKTNAETAKVEAEGKRDILKSIEVMAKAMSDNAENDREERKLRREQIEQQNAAMEKQNTAMIQIANNMSAFMSENVAGREQAAKAVTGAVEQGFSIQKTELDARFDNVDDWLAALADLQDEVRDLLSKQTEDISTIKLKVLEIGKVADNPPPVVVPSESDSSTRLPTIPPLEPLPNTDTVELKAVTPEPPDMDKSA